MCTKALWNFFGATGAGGLGWGDFVRGSLRRGNTWWGKSPSPLEFPKAHLPHAHPHAQAHALLRRGMGLQIDFRWYVRPQFTTSDGTCCSKPLPQNPCTRRTQGHLHCAANAPQFRRGKIWRFP